MIYTVKCSKEGCGAHYSYESLNREPDACERHVNDKAMQRGWVKDPMHMLRWLCPFDAPKPPPAKKLPAAMLGGECNPACDWSIKQVEDVAAGVCMEILERFIGQSILISQMGGSVDVLGDMALAIQSSFVKDGINAGPNGSASGGDEQGQPGSPTEGSESLASGCNPPGDRGAGGEAVPRSSDDFEF